MPKLKDLTGQKFGRLTVIERTENKGHNAAWKCLCDCGNICVVSGKSLRNGDTKSCGCLQKEHAFRIGQLNAKNLVGQRFGKLTVIERTKGKSRRVKWICCCDCGNTCIVSGGCLTSGNTQSCGCLQKERASESHLAHGMSGSLIYQVWNGIKNRCFNSNERAYKNYGKRGITMYPEWIENLQAFYDYVSQLPHFGKKGYTLDRIDNNGNYEPENLR